MPMRRRRRKRRRRRRGKIREVYDNLISAKGGK
jgi:hypothetical protein